MESPAPPTPNWLSDLTGQRVSDGVARTVFRYFFPIASVAMATVIDRHVPPLKNEAGIPLFFAAIMLSAWFGGWGPSLLATIASAVATTYFFDNIPGAAAVGWDDVIRGCVFLMVAALISSLTAIRK